MFCGLWKILVVAFVAIQILAI